MSEEWWVTNGSVPLADLLGGSTGSSSDLELLEAVTRWPSIKSYHKMDEHGRLIDELRFPEIAGEAVYATEKVDGSNVRVVVDSLLRVSVGTRNQLVMFRGEAAAQDSMGVVGALRGLPRSLSISGRPSPGHVRAYYGELYGGAINGHGHYTQDKTRMQWALFAIADFDIEALSQLERAEIAARRRLLTTDGVHAEGRLGEYVMIHGGGEDSPTVPYLGRRHAPPATVAEAAEWLAHVLGPVTRAAIGDAKPGKPEGVVITGVESGLIAKLRVKDYEGALGRKII